MATQILTFQDAIEHLVDFNHGVAQDVEQRLMKRAVRAAYEEIVQIQPWTYFFDEDQISLVASYSTGTIAYDHTGGSSERLITLSDGTFPAAWTQYARIKIDDNVYPIDRYLTSATATLLATLNPGADVAAGESYTLYRNTYPLPANFLRIAWLVDGTNWWTERYRTPQQWHGLESLYGNLGEPFMWTIMKDPDSDGQFVVRTVGYPGSAKILTFVYQSRGKQNPRISGFETNSSAGTITVVGDAPGVEGSGTTFEIHVAGAYLRIGDATNKPTGEDGLYPYQEQHRIRSRTDADTLVLETDAVTSGNTLKYTISSHLDMEPALIPAFLRGCEHQFAILTGDIKRPTKSAYIQAVRLAMESDDKLSSLRSATDIDTGPNPFQGNPSNTDFGELES